jgi:hypothetical protein
MRKLLTIVNARRRDELRGTELAIQNTGLHAHVQDSCWS